MKYLSRGRNINRLFFQCTTYEYLYSFFYKHLQIYFFSFLLAMSICKQIILKTVRLRKKKQVFTGGSYLLHSRKIFWDIHRTSA